MVQDQRKNSDHVQWMLIILTGIGILRWRYHQDPFSDTFCPHADRSTYTGTFQRRQ